MAAVSRRKPKHRKRRTTTRTYQLRDRHRFPNGEGRCTGVVRYQDHTVFHFVLPHLTGFMAYQVLVLEGAK